MSRRKWKLLKIDRIWLALSNKEFHGMYPKENNRKELLTTK